MGYREMIEELKITLTQSGQLRPYGDSIFAGTVEADSEQEARDKLQKLRQSPNPIADKGHQGCWALAYIDELTEVSKGKWKFRIIEPSTH